MRVRKLTEIIDVILERGGFKIKQWKQSEIIVNSSEQQRERQIAETSMGKSDTEKVL